ncbi:MAG: Rpn family recombination-promoting nuclease/putative transposase [Burkholderiaceae bacterium]|nr:Rpn family recombination-promoting nuclease/putative transposase [Burkholderiaceae bacterium]
MPHDHDSGYKRLFAAPEMMRDLLLGFVDHDWVRSADFASLCRVNGSYVSDDLRARHDDMVWKIRLRDEWFYLYLLLEFQSVPDRWMALRIQVYVGLLYQDLVARKETAPEGKLPPVLPIVLYNGHAPWRSADSLDALLFASPPGLAPYRAQVRYLLIDERRFATADLPLRNLVAALFRLEAARTSADFRTVTAHLLEWLSGSEPSASGARSRSG